ncbi:type II and III secretion system protein family protein [Burkholderiaceae bacterium FT117]|uniref:type II and III secretion system protein family protein n=1 Tax=Zeimonas sediminis TaxID=2944268 RepID=UPI002342E216|nr:type II and III secretion system protein family protein [Zeimonas sediminis]MCM5572085.1 type II and III secretion system protein family protein [Zeimonas sediminis]
MNRFSSVLTVSLLAAFAVPASAQQQLAQTAVESGVIMRGTTGVASPAKPAARAAQRPAASAPAGAASASAAPYEAGPAEIGPAMSLTIGKSTLVRLPAPISRISVGNPAVADVTLINPRELYLLGKTYGSTNVILWSRNGPTTIVDVAVGIDSGALQNRLRELLPNEQGIVVKTAADSVVLAGEVSSALQANHAVSIAEAFARSYAFGVQAPIQAGIPQAQQGQVLAITQSRQQGMAGGQTGPKIVNMMRIAQPQQVMLEVKVAELSKNLLDKLGVGINGTRTNGDWRYSILSNFLSNSSGLLGIATRGNSLQLDAEKQDGLVRVLAEPNIVAISGQEASFLAGGKIFIPVARANDTTGGTTITLEEKEFGVGLKFTPTVLDGGRINLRVAPEVSELSQTGSPFTTIGGQTSILPSFTTRRAQTTVQLMDGQSFAIAGLIKNNMTETVKRFPVLGEVPILGALFRSSEFQTDRSELMFVVTARLVKPLPSGQLTLPTDNFVPPSRAEFFANGQLEGSGHPDVPLTERQTQMMNEGVTPAPGGTGGFQVK